MTFYQRFRNGLSKIPMWTVGVAIGAVCLVIGYGREDFADIYRKAVMICLECIGIG